MSQQCDTTAKKANVIFATGHRSAVSRARSHSLASLYSLHPGWAPQIESDELGPEGTLFKDDPDK